MAKMTYEDVIDLIRFDDDCNLYCDNCLSECAKKEAVEITVECIKKHIPKKPIVSKIVMFSITNGECKEEVVSHYHCPVCGRIVYKYDCCADNNCRQKIDWSDEE